MNTPQRHLENFLIPADATVRQAFQKLDEVACGLLIVVDGAGLFGVLTDGDLRRAILKVNNLDQPIRTVANRTPITLKESQFTVEEASRLMIEKRIEAIPILNDRGDPIQVLTWYDLERGDFPSARKLDVPVVIMAGGKGTRLHPYTKVLPKPLIPIGDKPIIEKIMGQFERFGCNRFIVSVNYKAAMIRAYFADGTSGRELSFIEETEPRGTMGSLCELRGKFSQPFFVSNCDILVTADFGSVLSFHKEKAFDLTIVASLKRYQIPYGVLEIDEGGLLRQSMEKPSYDLLVNTGVYLVNPVLIDLIPTSGEYHITHLMQDMKARGLRIGVFPVSEKQWMDMGQVDELKHMLDAFGH